jgi:transcriptional regulator
MYIPTKMAMTDAQAIAEFISKFCFGALVSDNLNATHLPFILAPDEGAFGCLYGHFARANPQAMQQLVRKYEPELLEANEVMPEDYQARLRKAVVGFKIEIDGIHAKEKLGQHRKNEEQKGVYAALCTSDHADDRALAAYMKKRKLGLGND